ncbi:glutathione binding-like protein [Pararhizobium sp. IMCC21322]|uniref:glutathione binding-like protein n=1 Tax=Pararhizobium sp. IMCC21322 TaxID=3067903 RepID=UPI0027428270|nr:glutathione binding-like protein [Pararhizobium sp. IMCC21322]
MNLYVFPGACSLAINIALREANIPFHLIEVDYETRSLVDGTDFRTISPKGCVPALQLDNATCLTESIAIFDHIDFCAPEIRLLGNRGTPQRQAALEWLSFIATEIHKSFSPLFRPDTPAEFSKLGRRHLEKRLSVVEDELSKHPYVAGHHPSAADFYLFTLCRWMSDLGLCLKDWPGISAHSDLIRSRETVQLALKSENLCTD